MGTYRPTNGVRDDRKAPGLADDSRFASGCRRMETDSWRTLLDVTNAVVTKRDLGELRAAIAPNVRRIVSHDHTNLYVIDNQRRLQSSGARDRAARQYPDDPRGLQADRGDE